MITTYELVPYTKIGEFQFGMGRDDFRKICGPCRSFMCGFPVRNHICDDYTTLHGYFKPNQTLEAVSLFPDFLLKYENCLITVSDNTKDLIVSIKSICKDLIYIEKESSYVSMALGVVIYCEEDHVSNVLIFSHEYFDEENEYLKKNFGVTKFGL